MYRTKPCCISRNNHTNGHMQIRLYALSTRPIKIKYWFHALVQNMRRFWGYRKLPFSRNKCERITVVFDARKDDLENICFSGARLSRRDALQVVRHWNCKQIEEANDATINDGSGAVLRTSDNSSWCVGKSYQRSTPIKWLIFNGRINCSSIHNAVAKEDAKEQKTIRTKQI